MNDAPTHAGTERTKEQVPPLSSPDPFIAKRTRGFGFRRRLLLGFTVVVSVGFGLWFGVVRARGTDDLSRLQGEWGITVADRGEIGLIRIKGDRWVYVFGGQERSSHRITLNPAATPKEIDLTSLLPNGQPVIFTDGPGKGSEMKQRGVYTLEGDTLVIALVPVQEGPRPKTPNDPDGPPSLTLMRKSK